jgi:hypothetical protein
MLGLSLICSFARCRGAEDIRILGRWLRVDKALNKESSGGYLCYQWKQVIA